MLGVKSFYSAPAMAPHSKSKRGAAASPMLVSSPPKRKRTARQLKSAVLTPDIKPSTPAGARRSPRISKKVRVSLDRLPIGKENVKVKKVKEEEEEEEMVDVKPLKEELTSTDSDMEEEGGMSEYEKRRMENISKNAEFFASLQIFKAKENLDALSPQAQKRLTSQHRGLKSQKRPAEVLPRRAPSLRLQNKCPEGTELPEKFKEPPLYSLYLPQPRQHERKESSPIAMDATNVKKVEKTDEGADFVKGLAKLAQGKKTKVEVDNSDLDRFVKRLMKMKMKETSMAKVVQDRIFSVAVHPAVDRSIVCAGDKWGKIGLWDVNSSEGDDGVFLFEPHARPINCLRFAPHDPSKLYSVSYDGTVRCGDFDKEVFTQVYGTDEEYNIWTNYFDFLSSDGRTLLVTQNEGTGYVAVVDTRSSKSTAENEYMVHQKNAKTVSIHPTQPNYFVTASTDATAALWDIRSMKKSGLNTPIERMPHFKTVNSAFFSPITGNKILTTSMDNKISIFDTERAKEGKLTGAKRTMSRSHNNHTGRWLTGFRATWHTQREDAFVIGSMDQPRRIEMFSSSGTLIHTFRSEYLASVCSLNAFHPTRDLIVGGNSSGKLHVLMS